MYKMYIPAEENDYEARNGTDADDLMIMT